MSSGGKGGGGSQVTGYKYFFGIHMGIGRGPVDELCEIKVGDKTAWSGSTTTSGSVSIDNPELFGGEKKEGGIQGTLDVMMGESTQTPFGGVRALYSADLPVSLTISGLVTNANGIYSKVLTNTSELEYRRTDSMGVVWKSYRSGDGSSASPYQWTITDSAAVTYASISSIAATVPENAAGWKSVSYTQGAYDYETNSYQQIVIETPAVGVTVTSSYGSIPGFRRMFTAFFNGQVATNNPYPKPWKFRVRRVLKGWDGDVWQPALAQVNLGDIVSMNPAHIIYECLTNREWGRGLSSSMLDLDSFYKAALALKTEGFGLCMRWNRSDNIKAFVQSILDHIGGVMFTSRSTGLLVLRLIRDDYEFDELPHFTPDTGLLEVKDSAIASLGNAVNQIKVSYTDPKSGEEQTVTVSNLASIQAQGGIVNSQSKDYKGIPTAALATLVAQRDLRAASVNLRRFTITVDRRGRSIEPGGVFLISDDSRGIPVTPVRVGTIEDTSLTDGKINLVVAQDVFELPRLAWSVDVPNQWEPPSTVACLDIHKVFEVPYFMLAGNLSRANLAYVEADDGYLGAVCAQGKSTNAGYRIAVRTGESTPEDVPTSTDYFCGYVPPEN